VWEARAVLGKWAHFLVDACEEASPPETGGGALRGVRRIGRIGLGPADLGRRLVACGRGCVARRHAVVAAEGDDTFAQPRIWSEDAVITVTMDARWRDEAAEGGEELQRQEARTVRPLRWRTGCGSGSGGGSIRPPAASGVFQTFEFSDVREIPRPTHDSLVLNQLASAQRRHVEASDSNGKPVVPCVLESHAGNRCQKIDSLR
jgi:hypothetical protein